MRHLIDEKWLNFVATTVHSRLNRLSGHSSDSRNPHNQAKCDSNFDWNTHLAGSGIQRSITCNAAVFRSFEIAIVQWNKQVCVIGSKSKPASQSILDFALAK